MFLQVVDKDGGSVCCMLVGIVTAASNGNASEYVVERTVVELAFVPLWRAADGAEIGPRLAVDTTRRKVLCGS